MVRSGESVFCLVTKHIKEGKKEGRCYLLGCSSVSSLYGSHSFYKLKCSIVTRPWYLGKRCEAKDQQGKNYTRLPKSLLELKKDNMNCNSKVYTTKKRFHIKAKEQQKQDCPYICALLFELFFFFSIAPKRIISS